MLELLKKLSMINGVSGHEEAVRQFILNEIKEHCTYELDPLGTIIACKQGKKRANKKILFAAHMDEVGLIITSITDEGYLRFAPVGGIDPRALYGIVVRIGDTIDGVIGGRAVHHLSAAEKEKAPGVTDMLIDIGAKKQADAKQFVSPGDFAAFKSDFYPFGDGFIKGKALDDRIGCALMIELIKSELEYDAYFTFNVQEEVGLRGAKVSASTVQPEIAIVLEATTASDLSGVTGEKRVCVLGGGPVVSFMDGRTIYDKGLFQLAFSTAQAQKIQCQTKTAVAGGNDAGAIHLAGNGVRTLAISLPCRYIHTPSGVAKVSDIDAMRKLLTALLPKLYDTVY